MPAARVVVQARVSVTQKARVCNNKEDQHQADHSDPVDIWYMALRFVISCDAMYEGI